MGSVKERLIAFPNRFSLWCATCLSILAPGGDRVRTLGRIGVLAGGDSPEREVSLISGKSVHQALSTLGYSAHLIEISSLDEIVGRIRDIGLVFNCLHGGSGEDGTVQLLLDVMGIRYTGSGPQASARAMDKLRAKEIFAAKRIPTPKWMVYDGGS